ncbi:MAG: hypothetical protein WCL04_00180 [Verrucomicrobiota bacterium]
MTNRYPPLSAPAGRRPVKSRGFVLIVSLTLTAFLVVLLLSLTFLIRTGGQIADSGTAQIQAQQNALVGLQTAIGQLEKFAGHDQRITIQAEFADSTLLANGLNIPLPGKGRNTFAHTVTNSYVKEGKNETTAGLPQHLQAGSRFWTGVLGNLDVADDSYIKSPTPILLTWLVSGNEGVNFTTSTFGAGRIISATSASTMPYTPDSTIQGVTTTSTALSPNVTINGKQGVILVGPGTASWSTASTLPGQPDTYVAVPLVSITVSSAMIPGLGNSATGKLSGRFGYAVLDEGVKAKANLRDPNDGFNAMAETNSVSSARARLRIQVALRNGIELVPGFTDSISGGGNTATSISYPVNTSSTAPASTTFTTTLIPNVQSLQQLRFLDPRPNTYTTADAIIRSNFHNLTVSSYGLLTDTLRGGLKIDLTSLLDDGTESMRPTFNADQVAVPNFSPFYNERLRSLGILPSFRVQNSLPNGLARSLWIDPALRDPALSLDAKDVSPYNLMISGSGLALPSWDILKSWYDISKQLRPTPNASMIAQIGTSQIPSIGMDQEPQASNSVPILAHVAPQLVQARFYSSAIFAPPEVKMEPDPNSTLENPLPSIKTWTMTYSYDIRLAFAVGNPYNAALTFPKGLEFVWVNPGYPKLREPGPGIRSVWNPNRVNIDASFTDPRGGNARVSMPIFLNGQYSQGNTVSNSWMSKRTYINGLDPLPQIEPEKPSGLTGFIYYADRETNGGQPITIPAGGVLGFQLDPSTPAQTFADTTHKKYLRLITATIGAPNIITSHFILSSIGAGIVDGVDREKLVFTVSTEMTEVTVTNSLNKGAASSIYLRDYNDRKIDKGHQVYSSIINAEWADAVFAPRGTTTKIREGVGSVAGGNIGGFMSELQLPAPLLPFSITISYLGRIFNDYYKVNQGIGVPETVDAATGAYRTFADYNLQAQYHPLPWVSTPVLGLGPVPPYKSGYLDATGGPGATGSLAAVGRGLDRMLNNWPPAWGPNSQYTSTTSDNTNFNSSLSGSINYSTMLFDLPRRSSELDMPVLSIGFLQHANLTADDQYPFVGHQPGNAVGNSWFHPLVTRTMTKQIRPNIWYANAATITETTSNGLTGTNYFDMSYLLNTALWDRFYFAGIPQLKQAKGGTGRSANPRLVYGAGVTPTDEQLALYDRPSDIPANASAPDAFNSSLHIPKEYVPARYLMVDGAFNINSTSIEAWSAVLGGLRNRSASGMNSQTNIQDATTRVTGKGTSYPRTLWQSRYTAGEKETTHTFSSYAGYRRLTDAQIVALATTLVQEIRLRGPFPSLASFINRGGITGTTSAIKDLVMKGLEGNFEMEKGYLGNEKNTVEVAGALQMAIDRAGINITTDPNQIFKDVYTGSHSIAITSRPNERMGGDGAQSGIPTSKTDSTPFADVLPNATISLSVTTVTAPGEGVALSRSTGIPGWLTQADILQAIGPNLSARSDTFVIRAYGDAVDPLNANPDKVDQVRDIKARAWLEAVVQRFPDYIDPRDPASVHPSGEQSIPESHIEPVNQVYGRRFRIVSFRWLTQDEI